MRYFLTLLLFLTSLISFAADKDESKKAAVVIENYSKEFDVIFFAKIILVFILAIVAAISYSQFVKHERK